jgi:hypothetical protein
LPRTGYGDYPCCAFDKTEPGSGFLIHAAQNFRLEVAAGAAGAVRLFLDAQVTFAVPSEMAREQG